MIDENEITGELLNKCITAFETAFNKSTSLKGVGAIAARDLAILAAMEAYRKFIHKNPAEPK